MKVQTFLAIGGTLNGHRVTEDYAGDEYTRFNSSLGIQYKMKEHRYGKGPGCVGLIFERDAAGKKIVDIPGCILVHDSIFEEKTK